MKKGCIAEGIVERCDFPNKGIVISEEEKVVVKNTLPGQKVRFRVNKVRKGKAEGQLLEVVEKSPLETCNLCSLFGLCGGCTYLSLPYEEQLKIKKEQIYRLLEPVVSTQNGEWSFEGIKGSPKDLEYRNKMEFTFGDEYKDGPLALGMHKRGSFYDLVTVDECKIVDADYRLIITLVREFFSSLKVPYFHRLRHEGYLRHLLVRKATKTGEILIGLVTSSQVDTLPVSEKQLLDDFLNLLLTNEDKMLGKFAGILHIVNDSVADVVKSDRTDILYGKDSFGEELLGLKFNVSTFSFFQTNSYGAEVLYDTVREYVRYALDNSKVSVAESNDGSARIDTIFDLYCGTGTITQLMSPVAQKVVGVEIVEEAVEAAKVNAMANGIDNCEFIAGDVLKVLDDLESKPNLIILDPPRDGIHPKALPKIIDYGVENIIYISCKPTSLARDLEVFIESGYEVIRTVVIDQFPQTANAETICLITR